MSEVEMRDAVVLLSAASPELACASLGGALDHDSFAVVPTVRGAWWSGSALVGGQTAAVVPA